MLPVCQDERLQAKPRHCQVQCTGSLSQCRQPRTSAVIGACVCMCGGHFARGRALQLARSAQWHWQFF